MNYKVLKRLKLGNQINTIKVTFKSCCNDILRGLEL